MKTGILLAGAIFMASGMSWASDAPAKDDKKKAAVAHDNPSDCWEAAIESGYLWNVGHNTPIHYEIMPNQLVLRSPIMWRWWEGASGAQLIVRNRFALLGETIVVGPENHYFAFSAAPSIELWNASRTTALVGAVGGGFGVIDSTRVRGGQGEDFTLNWFSEVGVRQMLTNNVSLQASAYFTHHSNGGRTTPNPGIDALGFTVGLGCRF